MILRNSDGTGVLDQCQSMGCCSGGGITSLPPCLVYPLLGLLIGGFIAWGEMSGSKNIPVEDDGQGVFIFWFLLIAISVLFYAMFVRLDKLSHKEERHRIYSRIAEDEPSHVKRHRFCVSAPWDSYQWAAGALLIAISEIFWGILFPGFRGWELYASYVWIALFIIVWGTLLVFMCIDPSQGVPEDDVKATIQGITVDEKPLCSTSCVEVGPGGGPGSLCLWCNLSGCKRYYHGSFRKHCKACNKCVEGFDHHCPFLNQCIGTHNYKWFMAILTAYIALMVVSIIVGLFVICQLSLDPNAGVTQYANKVWGQELFAFFAAMIVIFPMPKLYFMVPLWLFHIKLCLLTWKSGEFHGTYMFTRNWTTGELRGRVSYMDERARLLLLRVSYFYNLDRPSAFHLWAMQTNITKENRYVRGSIMNSWLTLCSGVVGQMSGVSLVCGEGKNPPPRIPKSDEAQSGPLTGGLSKAPQIPPFGPSAYQNGEEQPLLQSVVTDEQVVDSDSGRAPHHRDQLGKKGCLPDCKPAKDKK